MDPILLEIEELNKELETLKESHDKYNRMVASMKDQQKKCMAETHHQKYRMKQITDELKKLKKSSNEDTKKSASETLQQFNLRKTEIGEIEQTLPKKNGLYLNVVLGQVNVSLLSKQDKFAYKEDYERFKLIVTIIAMTLSFILYFWLSSRVFDAAYHFLLVWYYCTLTIREHILITNGSKIKGWWLLHHFITTAQAGILLIWPKSESYDAFRNQFMLFQLVLHNIQFMQYYYQRGCLYKMRALGQRHSMDITVDGFMSWMSIQLSFLLPFLFCAYFFQLYNAYTLFHISMAPYCKEWQVFVLCIIYFVLFFGNVYTTLRVIRQKIYSKAKDIQLTSQIKYAATLHPNAQEKED